MKLFLSLICALLIAGTASAQNQKASTQASASGSFIPAGVIMPYAGTTAPSGWVLAYGQEVSQTSATYKNLYSAINTTYCTTEHGGTCTGGNFRLPDLRGRSIHGKDNMGGTAASRITTAATIDGTVLGKSGGAQTNTLGSGNIPQVSTSYTPAGTNAASGVSGSILSNTTGMNFGPPTGGTADALAVGRSSVNNGYASLSLYGDISGTAAAQGFTGTAATITVGSASPSAVNNLTPTTIMNYIIKL